MYIYIYIHTCVFGYARTIAFMHAHTLRIDAVVMVSVVVALLSLVACFVFVDCVLYGFDCRRHSDRAAFLLVLRLPIII